jgi:hypothetical protein
MRQFCGLLLQNFIRYKYINNIKLTILQALEWIHDTGEFYLSTHTTVGENEQETTQLLKEHHEFKTSAKVTI